MFGKTFQRTWVSPIVALSFAVVGISGVLMLFEVRSFPMKVLHEWMGVMMVAAGTIHLFLNWKAFSGYFRNRSAMVALVAGTLLCCALIFAGGGEDPRHGGPHMGPRDGQPAMTETQGQ